MMTQKLKSSLGYTLIEIMVVISILSIVALGSASLIQSIFQLQRIQESKLKLLEFSRTFQSVLQNQTYWALTYNHASNTVFTSLACLRVGGTCLNNSTDNNFNVFDGPGLFYQGSVATTGVTESGLSCTTFPSLLCPFRFNLTTRNVCTNNEATCDKPNTIITANFVKANIDDSLIRKIDDRTAANGGTISFEVRLGQNVRYEPFEIVEYSDSTGATGGGACTPGAWSNRPFTTVLANVGNNMTLLAGPSSFQILSGEYECTISLDAYDQVNGFKIQLIDDTGAVTSLGSGITKSLTSTTISAKVLLKPTAVRTYRLQHLCVSAAADPTIANTDFGRPLPNYADQTVFTRIYCVRTL
jgi:prepilin-type N-terminal cleavage/methylation domain-containing protein